MRRLAIIEAELGVVAVLNDITDKFVNIKSWPAENHVIAKKSQIFHPIIYILQIS